MARLFCLGNISNFQDGFIYANDTGNDGEGEYAYDDRRENEAFVTLNNLLYTIIQHLNIKPSTREMVISAYDPRVCFFLFAWQRPIKYSTGLAC